MQLFVKTLRKVISVDVVSSDLISVVKSRIQNKERIPVDQQGLFLSGKELEDARTLDFYGIQTNSTLLLHSPRAQSCSSSKQIIIQIANDATFRLDVENFETIERVKSRIQEKIGIPSDQGKLFFAGNCLKETRTLASYAIPKEATLEFRQRERGDIQISIRTLTGETLTIRVEHDDSVAKLKERIEFEEGIHPDHQKLLFVGKNLEDGRLLSDYNIREGSMLHLVLRLRGGKKIFDKDGLKAVFDVGHRRFSNSHY